MTFKFLSTIAILCLLLLLAVSGCKKKYSTHYNKSWKTYTIDSGQHASSPLNPGVYTFQSRWDTGCAKGLSGLVNNVGTTDSLDWSKFPGYKFGVGTNSGRPNKAALIGWRSRLEVLDSICLNTNDSTFDTIYYTNPYLEFCAYFNNYPDSAIVFPSPKDIIRVEVGQVVHWVRSFHNKRAKVEIWTNHDYISKELYMGKYNVFYSSGLWYGGTSAAPGDLTVDIKQ